jgi:hypothetical protein
MPQLIATLLGLVILAAIAVNVDDRFEINLQQQAYQSAVSQAARQQASFALAVFDYVTTSSPSSGTVLTVTSLQAAGELSPGFPSTNPFGQTPVAYVGSNETALATYTGPPDDADLEPLGLKASSNTNLETIAYTEAKNISVMQAGYPQFGGAMLYQATFTTPFGAVAIPSANYFSGISLPAGPVFADLINVIAQPTLSSSSTAGYGTVTGD